MISRRTKIFNFFLFFIFIFELKIKDFCSSCLAHVIEHSKFKLLTIRKGVTSSLSSIRTIYFVVTKMFNYKKKNNN